MRACICKGVLAFNASLLVAKVLKSHCVNRRRFPIDSSFNFMDSSLERKRNTPKQTKQRKRSRSSAAGGTAAERKELHLDKEKKRRYCR